MTQQSPVFSVSEFELRNYTDPYLSPEQKEDVNLVEERVNTQLNFLAQMLGWNGPDYWDNLPDSVDQKRQLLGGTYGVYNSYIIPRVIEVRNWDNTVILDGEGLVRLGKQTKPKRILLGDNSYTIQAAERDGDKFVVTFDELPDQFYTDLANGEQIKVDVPTFRPAPFYRPEVGISADADFLCVVSGSDLTLYPSYDYQSQFPYNSAVLFEGSVYYFDKPIYIALDSSLSPVVTPSYDADRQLWYLQVPTGLGFTAYLVAANSSSVESTNANLEVKIQQWRDPSDWGEEKILDNFEGTWGNKGGILPYNFVFDSLSLHGFDETQSVVMEGQAQSLNFNDIIDYVYYQKVVVSQIGPGDAKEGDLWWDSENGVMACWLSTAGCGSWVSIDYRQAPDEFPAPQVIFPDVAAFQAGQAALNPGTIVRINDILGLSVSDNVIGVQGTLPTSGSLVLHRETDSPYWTPDEFVYLQVSDFSPSAALLPYNVPVTIQTAAGLSNNNALFTVKNLGITITGEYEVVLRKFYKNDEWLLYPDSLLKFIAYTTLFGGNQEGSMWWNFATAAPFARSAAVYYENYWIQANSLPLVSSPAAPFDMGVILFYCNGQLLQSGVSYLDDDFTLSYSENPTTGQYEFTYVPRTFRGTVNYPVITISDSLTSAYRAEVTDLVFSGFTHTMKPNVYNAETPLRLWKAQDLQVAETVAHLDEGNYSNPLLADINSGPGPENWEKYFVRLPLEYGRNELEWQKTALICKDFGYWGTTIDAEKMKCPPEDDTPAIYEELFLYRAKVDDYTYVYTEPYLYSNLAYIDGYGTEIFENSGVFPTFDVQFDEFFEANLITYEPLHNRTAITNIDPVRALSERFDELTLNALQKQNLNLVDTLEIENLYLKDKVYGDWAGIYLNVSPCKTYTGYLLNDLESKAFEPTAPPVWDASIYKYPPTCQVDPASYLVDSNHFKIGYAYFCADASAAEDAFFDITQEASWRYTLDQPKTSYITTP